MKTYHHKQEGFSLIEILVVLAIMGVMLSLVSVNLVRTISSVRFVKTSEAAIADIKLMRAEAMLNRESRIMLTQDTQINTVAKMNQTQLRSYNVPEGWIVKGAPIKILKSGACLGGTISFTSPEGRFAEFTLVAPKCRLASGRNSSDSGDK